MTDHADPERAGRRPATRPYDLVVPHFRISEAAGLLGVSDDTIRRWIDSGTLPVDKDAANVKVVDGVALAEVARTYTRPTPDPSGVQRSARNRMVGLVTAVTTGGVMAQVEIQCGPHRVVSLMGSEAALELQLEPGVLAVAVVKSTSVVIETPLRPSTPVTVLADP